MRFLLSSLLVGGSVLMSGFTVPGTAKESDPKIQLTRSILLDSMPDQLMDAEVGPKDRFCIADGGRGEVRCFDWSGRTLWHAGRRGEGPGEYRNLYRIGIGPTGAVVALDIAKMTVTQYDAAGKFIRSGLVPFTMRQVSDLVVVDDSTLAMAGYASTAGAASRSGVHLFRWDSSVTHLRSVGRLPQVGRPELLNYWGSGNLRGGPGGNLFYEVVAPHVVITFGRDGELLATRPLAIAVSGPDEVFTFEESSTRFAIRRSKSRTTMPLGVEPLSPSLWVMGRRITPDSSQGGAAVEVIDVFAPGGTSLASWQAPDSLSPMGLIDGPSSARGFFGLAVTESGIRLLVFEFKS